MITDSPLEQYFLSLLHSWNIAEHFVREHKFDPYRKWRFDFADTENKIAVEFEGGVWTQGRHVTGSGYVRDCEKYSAATIQGWKVMRFATKEQMNTFERDYRELLAIPPP